MRPHPGTRPALQPVVSFFPVESLEPRLLLSATEPLAGDVNRDGVVDAADVLLVQSQWNQAVNPDTTSADLDGDGYVGLLDLDLVLKSPYFMTNDGVVQPVQTTATEGQTSSNTQTLQGLYTDFNGTITGTWQPQFDRDTQTIDPDGQLVDVDEPRWGELVGTSATQAWELVRAGDPAMFNIGYGPGADGKWLSIWFDASTDELIVFNDDLTQWKTISAGRDGQVDWLIQSEWESDTRYVPRTGQIVPGGLWITYLQRETDMDPTPGVQDWTPIGTSFGVVQEVTYDNIFNQPRTILDTPRAQGLIDSSTGMPYENARGREWSISITPVVVNDRVEEVWWTITDYMMDSTAEVAKPGGTTWVFLAEREASGNHYTVRQPRVIEQQEDPQGKEYANEHRHSAIIVIHETGEVDVVVAAGDTASHSFLKRYRILDPDHYETSALQVQETGLLGITGEASPNLISFQVGSAPNTILAASDLGAAGILELTIPVDMSEPAEVRSIIGRAFSETHSLVVNLECAKPWERSGYAFTVRPNTNVASDQIPLEAATIFYSSDGINWVEAASNVRVGEIVFHDDILVVRNVGDVNGIYKTTLSEVDAVSPLLISPGGTQRLAETLTQQISYEDATVTFLENVGGVWMDNGVALDSQPPTFGPVLKLSKTDEPLSINLARLFLAGTDADFPAGGYVLKVWVMPVAGYSPVINLEVRPTNAAGNIQQYRPVANQDWHPILTWDNLDPHADGSDYLIISNITAYSQGVAQRTEFYIAFDLLLNQSDAVGTVAPAGDLDADAYVGLSDLEVILADWNKSTIPDIIDGDFDKDGFVGLADMDLLLNHWNQTVSPGEINSGDGTGDGYVGLDDLDLLLSAWNTGQLPMEHLQADINQDGLVGLDDLDTLLSEWNVFRPTAGIVPGYAIAPSDTTNLTAEPEKLTWDMPAPTDGSFTVAVAMSIPVDGIDSSWGETEFRTGSTNYGTLYADENNYIELWNHRESQTWALAVVADGRRIGVITLEDAWVNIDGRLNWAISYDPAKGLSFALLNRGNVVSSGSLAINLPFTPTSLRIGSHDWLSVPTVGVKSAYYNQYEADTLYELKSRVLQDVVYLD